MNNLKETISSIKLDWKEAQYLFQEDEWAIFSVTVLGMGGLVLTDKMRMVRVL